MAHRQPRVAVHHRHGQGLAGLLVDRHIALRAGGDLHGGSDHAILAIRAKPALGAVIAVGDPAVAREAVEVAERTEQGLLIDIHAAFLAQQQRGEHLRACRVQQATRHIAGIDAIAPMRPPAAELLAGLRVVAVSVA